MWNQKLLLCLVLLYSATSLSLMRQIHEQTLNIAQLRLDELAKHNAFRATHGSPPLTLDDSLNTAAQNYAGKLVIAKTLTHSAEAISGTYGENLYYQWRSPTLAYVGGTASSSWYYEINYYDYNTFKTTTPGKAVGHFTALVWKASTKVGFGFAGSSQSKVIRGSTYNGQSVYVVANYLQAGNMVGAYAANVVPPVVDYTPQSL